MIDTSEADPERSRTMNVAQVYQNDIENNNSTQFNILISPECNFDLLCGVHLAENIFDSIFHEMAHYEQHAPAVQG